MKNVKKIVYVVADAFGAISAVGYLAIIAICVLDVILEKIFHAPVHGSVELVERAMMVAVFASFGYAQARKAHINMTIVVERLNRVLRLVILGITSLMSVATTAYAANGAWTMCKTSFEYGHHTGVLEIPLWPFYLLESVSMYFFSIVLLLDSIFIFIALKDDAVNDEITEEYAMILPNSSSKPPKIDVNDIPLG